MLSFFEWLESVRHHFLWGDDIEATDQKDNLGIPLLQRPGFRPKEKKYIEQQSDQVTEWLNQVTKKYGIHWEVIYLEPDENETDSPEGFKLYKDRSIQIAKEKMSELGNNFAPTHPEEKPPTANNTIVYVKPTSRVHQLSAHQQVHNIGHAIFGYAKSQRSAFVLKLQRIAEAIKRKMEQEANSVQGSVGEITQDEIILVISRLVNLKSMKRMFSMSPEDFADPKKSINQVYGNLDEFLYELVAAFFRGGGRINLRPQDELKGKLTPTAGIQNHPTIKIVPREWVWNQLFEDQNFWNKVSDELTMVVVSALYQCTFSKLGRPIYATYGGLPQV